jgi:hypothetical protein
MTVRLVSPIAFLGEEMYAFAIPLLSTHRGATRR